MGKLAQRLGDAARSGVYRAPEPAALPEAARAAGLDLVRIRAEDDPLGRIAAALDFPAWFGGNWDALEDCLGDLSWRSAGGHVLLFETYPRGEALGVLLDVLRASADYWAQRGRPFFALLVDPPRELALPELEREA
ncbi:MAG TPA: barstar family protein [Burkholderiales bacterium]